MVGGKRQTAIPRERRNHHRQRPRSAQTRFHDRQRQPLGYGHRRVRQGWAKRARGRGAADAAD